MSSTILMVIVLVVMWLVVLLPMFVRRHDRASEERSADRFATAMRVLARRPPSADGQRRGSDSGRSTARAAAASAGSGARVEPGRPGPTSPRLSDARRRMLHRRRRTLLLLTGGVLAGLAGALWLTPWLWVAHASAAVLTTGYVWWLRQEVRRERQRRLRRAALFARPAPLQPPHVVRTSRAVRRPAGGASGTVGARAAGSHGTQTGTARSQTAGGEPRSPKSGQPTGRAGTVAGEPRKTRAGRAVDGSASAVELDDDDLAFAEIDSIVPTIDRRRVANY